MLTAASLPLPFLEAPNGDGLTGHHGRTLFFSFTLLMLSRILLLLPVVFHVAALRFSVNGVHKREHISGLDNAQNLKYFANITLGGKYFSVQIDTGRQAINTLFLYLTFNSSLVLICGSGVTSPTRMILAFQLAFNMPLVVLMEK